MADNGGKVSYWREATLVYPDEEITVVLPAPIIAKLQEGDMKLMAEIKNIKETGAPIPACPATEETQNETLVDVCSSLSSSQEFYTGCSKTPMPSPESNSDPSTSKHCENKYKSLKREYRATIDHNSKSGNDRKSCAFFDEFSELYGMKAGSRPKFTIGILSGSSSESSQLPESFSSDEQPHRSKEKQTKNRKRKTAGVTDWLESYEERQVDLQKKKNRMKELKEMHDEKMQMMEKLLNVLQEKKK